MAAVNHLIIELGNANNAMYTSNMGKCFGILLYKRMLVALALVLIVSSFSTQLPFMYEAWAQGITANTNQRSYTIKDTLVVYGKSLPNDSLITELFNPKGRLVSRNQIDVGVEGSFSKILLEWQNPNESYPFGVYTLTVMSSLDQELRTNLVFKFTDVASGAVSQERRLELQVSVSPVIGKNETAKIIVKVLLNGVLVMGSAEETLKDSRIYFPNGTVGPIDNFSSIDDGIYLADFGSNLEGHHTILVEAFHQGLIASNAQGVIVEEGRVLSLGKEILRVNENLEKLRAETIEKNNQLADDVQSVTDAVEKVTESVDRVSQASGQVSSLLLPVIGMIVVVVVLQATMLSKRAKTRQQ